MKSYVPVSIVSFLLLLSGCGSESDDSIQVEDSEERTFSGDEYELYRENSCITCHGDQLQGATGPTLIGLDYSAEEIEAIIKEGIGYMAPQKVEEEDREALAKWISEL
ncbi:cytochrome c [Shouchella sp. 1P09AA]|uniref:c-type cytochrome n=1 Tax=unclassified Shouchella TaxID=2893065 RepID=UPI0039A30389